MIEVIRQSREGCNKLLVIIDSGVLAETAHLSEQIIRYVSIHSDILELVAAPLSVKGGEACKQEPSEINNIHELVEQYNLCRHSFIIAIGGGALLDAVGYAAATAHRGVRLIRMPTTVLAQNDAGVGVKNSVNAFGRKNFIGTFTPPFAVINDSQFLDTLSERDLRGGVAEAVKVALIRDKQFFEYLYEMRFKLADFLPEAMEEMIFRCAEIHLQHIATSGDPFEYGSSRPLDFGHWSAHKLEELSGGDLRHGEAVAIGIALDSLYSEKSGLLCAEDLNRILELLHTLGFNLVHPALSLLDVKKGLADFQEHLGGELSIPLLTGIGVKTEVNHIDIQLMQSCITVLMEGVSAA